jgi:hypothetical protein
VFGDYWQYQLPLWVVFFLFLILLLIPMEVGFRLGSRRGRSQPVPEAESRGDITLNGMLTLLALMLAFTYSFCVSRADLRKKAIITEVNAIGTAFLRAGDSFLLSVCRENRPPQSRSEFAAGDLQAPCVLEVPSMANHLSMANIQAIAALHCSGHSNRQIGRILGINRETVGKYVAELKQQTAQNQPNPQTGSGELATPSEPASSGPASSCAPHRELILNWLDAGLSIK